MAFLPEAPHVRLMMPTLYRTVGVEVSPPVLESRYGRVHVKINPREPCERQSWRNLALANLGDAQMQSTRESSVLVRVVLK